MTYSDLDKKLSNVPEEYFSLVSPFLDVILALPKDYAIKREKMECPILGLAKGKWKNYLTIPTAQYSSESPMSV